MTLVTWRFSKVIAGVKVAPYRADACVEAPNVWRAFLAVALK